MNQRNHLHSRRQLRRILIEYFDLDELRSLAFELGADWDELGGNNKSGKVESLIQYQMRRNNLPELLDLAKESRPNINWSTELSDQENQKKPKKLYHNLPQPDFIQFIGRKKEFDQIINLLKPYPSSYVHLISIKGIGGIGKSALALHIAYYYYQNFNHIKEEEQFDAIIWISAKVSVLTTQGIIQKRIVRDDLRSVFNEISITLEREDITSAPPEDQRQLVRKVFADQRVLLVIDQIEVISEFSSLLEFLLELPAPTKIIVTSRNQIAQTFSIHLLGMPWSTANNLIEQECKVKSIELPESKRKKLYDLTGGVPLALVWSIGLLFAGHGIDSVLYRLEQVSSDVSEYIFQGLLNEIKGSNSYRLLLSLALFSSDASRNALSHVSGISNMLDRDEALAELQSLSLVNHAKDRFNLLPLTKQLALSELNNYQDQNDLISEWQNWLLETAKLYKPNYWYDFNALELKTEIENLQSGLDWSIGNENWQLFLGLVVVICWYYNYTGLWTDLLETANFGVKIAREQGDLKVEAELRSALLGFAHSQRHEFDLASQHVSIALQIYRNELKEPQGEALALSFLAQVKRKEGDLETAEGLYKEAYQKIIETEGKGRTYIAIQFELGKLQRDMSNWDAASERFEEVKKWLEQRPNDSLNNSQLPGAVLGHLALIQYHQGNLDAARSSCIESLQFFEEQNLRVALGSMYWRLALIEHAQNNNQEALEALEESIYWFERLGMLDDLQRANEYKKDLISDIDKEDETR